MAYTLSPEALEARRLGGLARQRDLGESGRRERASEIALKRWDKRPARDQRGRFASKKRTKAAVQA